MAIHRTATDPWIVGNKAGPEQSEPVTSLCYALHCISGYYRSTGELRLCMDEQLGQALSSKVQSVLCPDA